MGFSVFGEDVKGVGDVKDVEGYEKMGLHAFVRRNPKFQGRSPDRRLECYEPDCLEQLSIGGAFKILFLRPLKT